MRILLVLLLILPLRVGAAYTEFYCIPTGTNINSGHTTDDAATYTSANGNWDGTSIFTPTDGSTPASTVTNEAWVSVYNDGAISAVYIAKITNVAAGVNGAITVDRAAFAGTPPTSSATGRSIKVGGAWYGPGVNLGLGGTTNWAPINLVANTLTNSSGNVPRINLQGVRTVTNVLAQTANGPIVFQGYTNTPGDGGQFVITNTSNAGDTFSGANLVVADIIWDGTGGGSSGQGPVFNGAECVAYRVTARKCSRYGIVFGGIGTAIECLAYSNNTANPAAASIAGIRISAAGGTFIRCISRDNTGSKGTGFALESTTGIAALLNCIAYGNGTNGFLCANGVTPLFSGCDSYNNGGHGLDITAAAQASPIIQNCNFFKNAFWGIQSSGSTVRNGYIQNCAFGAGTQANGAGTISTNITSGAHAGIVISGSLNYGSNLTPWTDPANGDFSIASGVAGRAAGSGLFPGITVGYPDIGAAQSASTNAAPASGGGAYTFAQ